MKKALLFLAVLATCSLAVFMGVKYDTPATAGMTTITNGEMDAVTGQTGITIDTDLNIEQGNMAWEDNDGFTGAAGTGAVILSGISLPTFMFSHVDIDAGTNTTGSYLQIDVPAVSSGLWPLYFGYAEPATSITGMAPLVYGDFSVESVIIGDSITATSPSLGKMVTRQFILAVDYIRISGH